MADIIERLRELEKLKTGEPLPSWLPANDWGTPLSDLCGAAADRIEQLEHGLDKINERVERLEQLLSAYGQSVDKSEV